MLIHGNSLVFEDQGILILGSSGSGKSDLSLRIIDAGGILISDDYTELSQSPEGRLIAKAPKNLCGLIEIRGVGILNVPYVQNHSIAFSLNLVADYPRFPEKKYVIYENCPIPQYFLNPFEISVVNKIKYILRLM